MTARELPSLNALRAFEAAARLQSVTKAAAELHVTHGAVSRQLRMLEDTAGRPLFARQGRGLVLTEVGQELQRGTANAFEQLRESWAAARRMRQNPFVLGCPGSLLARWVIPRLDRLGRDLPEMQLHLSAQEEPLAPDLDGLDGALLLSSPPWPASWRVTTLAAERIGPVVSPRYAGLERLQGQPPEVLLTETVLHTQSRPQAWRDWAEASGLSATPPTREPGFAHLYYLLEAALAGLGVAIAPAPLAAEDIASGRLLAPWGFCETGAAWVLATPQRANDPRSTVLMAWLQRELAGS